MLISKKYIILSFLFIGFSNVFAQQNFSKEYLAQRKIFIDKLMAKMTLDEKLGQLNLPSSGDITTGQAQSSDIAKKITEGKVGGLFNIKSVAKIKEVQRLAVEKTRLKIPLIFGMDVIHGYETTFPIPLALSCSWDMNLIKKSAQIAAQEASADGINWTFSPMVDLARDPRWGRIAEGSGEDAFLGSKIAKAMVEGYQGTDLKKNNTLLSCVKHYALYGAPEGGRDYNTVDMSRLRMYNEYFPPYKAAVEAGVGSVMTSFNEIDGIPASGNKWLMTDVLRKQWGFKGFVVTDYTAIEEMMYHGMGNMQDVSAMSLKAGVEMDMVSDGFLNTLKKSLTEKKVTQADIDRAVRLILEAKYNVGLFDNPYLYCDENRAKTEIYTPENKKIAREIATETFVLLKNSNQILPLDTQKKIALIGPLADAKENMAGTWSVAANNANSISVLAGLKNVFIPENIRYAKGSNLVDDPKLEERATMFGKTLHRDNRTKEELLKEAVEIAQKADVLVLALGESAEFSGESSSRTNLEIPKAQQDLFVELKKLNKPIVLILFTGRPLVLNDENQWADAILNVWFGGSEAGNAVADVLTGKINPSGKLTTTFPRSVGQIPIYYNHKNTGRPLSPTKTNDCEFEKFKSNYIDECNTPLFPFGYGLSYTTFAYKNLKVSNTKIKPTEKLKISVEVTNTGNFDGKEVVQLYIRDLVGSITRPVKELKGFEKIFLKKGETKTVTFTISVEDLKFYNSDLKFVAEAGDFEIFVGKNSSEVLSSKFSLTN